MTTLSPSVMAIYGGLPIETERKLGVESYVFVEDTCAHGRANRCFCFMHYGRAMGRKGCHAKRKECTALHGERTIWIGILLVMPAM